MSLDRQIDSVVARLGARTATPAECLQTAAACVVAGKCFDALLILDKAVVRFPIDPLIREKTAALLQRMEADGSLASPLDMLPAHGDRIRERHGQLHRSLSAHHGPGGARPATDHFFQCVLLKNLCQHVSQKQPIWQLLLRICDHHGRRAAEQALGQKAEVAIMTADRVVTLPVGTRSVRCRLSSAQLGVELLYFYAFEPGMIRWIASFDPGDVFVDIGANIGKYSLFAAVTRGCRTIAIEPFTPNTLALEQNIALNEVGDLVTARQWAISDRTAAGRLSYGSETAGAAAQSFDEPATDHGGTDMPAEILQGYRLDDLIEAGEIPCPQHIKIDVDGTEHRIIAGMEATLDDPRLRSIRLEIRLADPRNQEALRRIDASGFDCAVDDDEKNMLCRRR